MSTKKGILQKTPQPHDTHKLKWDESKLKATEKQKEQVTMKVDEPNTPYVRYNAETDQVTNWQDLPENLRVAHEEPDEFSLDGGEITNVSFDTDAWDDEEEQEKKEQARKRHEEFEKKRAQHYDHAADIVFHNNKRQ